MRPHSDSDSENQLITMCIFILYELHQVPFIQFSICMFVYSFARSFFLFFSSSFSLFITFVSWFIPQRMSENCGSTILELCVVWDTQTKRSHVHCIVYTLCRTSFVLMVQEASERLKSEHKYGQYTHSLTKRVLKANKKKPTSFCRCDFVSFAFFRSFFGCTFESHGFLQSGCYQNWQNSRFFRWNIRQQ